MRNIIFKIHTTINWLYFEWLEINQWMSKYFSCKKIDMITDHIVKYFAPKDDDDDDDDDSYLK
jgi:hypothetical protein